MNRFFDIPGIASGELLPAESRRRNLPETTGQFQLHGNLRFKSSIAGGVIVVPDGFISDLASIPGFAAWFMDSDDQRIAAGAWVHGFLYRNQGMFRMEGESWLTRISREHCDQILCQEAMPDLGASKFQCGAVYRALRLFGGSAWSDAGLAVPNSKEPA